MIVDSYDVVFGQLDPEEMRRVNRSRNYAQALISDPRDIYSAFDEVEQEFGARKVKYAAQGYDPFSTFNPDAPSGVDPFTGATARDYAELLYPVVKSTVTGPGTSLLAGAYQAAGHMGLKMLEVMKYASERMAPTGPSDVIFQGEKIGPDVYSFLEKAFRETTAKGNRLKELAKKDGVGPITEWFTETLGSAPFGIAEFMLGVPYYGAKGASEAREAGGNEFVGFLKGAIERGLMGQVLHAAATLSRPLRMGVTGAVFEEQARHEGITDPEELLKAFATGSLFGVVGGKGKYGPHEIRKELANLEMEAREWIEGLDPRAVIGERGSNKGSYIGDPITPWLDRYEKVAKGEGTARDVTTLRNQTVAIIDRSIKFYDNLMGKASEPKEGEIRVERRGKEEGSFYAPEGESAVEYGEEVHRFVVSDPSKIYKGHDTMGMFRQLVDLKKGDPLLDKYAEEYGVDPRDTATWGSFINSKLFRDAPVPTGGTSSFGENPYLLLQEKVKQILEKRGYKGVELVSEDNLNPRQFMIWDKSILRKTTPEEDSSWLLEKPDKAPSSLKQAEDEFNRIHSELIKKYIKYPDDYMYGGAATEGRDPVRERATPDEMAAYKKAYEDMKRASEEYKASVREETEGTKLLNDLRKYRQDIDNARSRSDVIVAIDRFVHATHGKGELLLRGMYGDNQGIAEAGAKLQEALDRLAGKSPVEGKKVLERGMAGDDISADLLKSGIPGFKNTEEAEAFGKKATPEQVARMKEVLERGYDDVASRKDAVAEALKAGDFEPTNALMKDIHRNQLLREAIESAGEKPPEPPPPGGGTKGGAGGGGKGEEPKFPVIPREEPKKYTKVLWAKKGQDRAIDPHGRELLHDVTEIEVGVEGETGKPGGKKRYLWEVTKEEGEALLRANGLSPELHKLAIDKALLQGKNVPLEAMRGYFPEGDLLVMEGIDGIFGLKEYEMQKWLDMKTDAALLYEHTKKMLTEKDRRDIKARVREVTGQIPASDIIEMREDQLLRNQLKMEALAARGVFRTGLKEGQLLHAKRFQEIIEMARERGDARREINYMIRELRTVDPDKMTAHCSDEVHRLLDHLDLKKLSTNKRISLEKTLDFLSRNPETELPEYVFDDLARLNKIPIRDLSYYEIQSIHKAVMSLAAQSERVQYLNVKMRRMKVDEAIKQSLSEMRDPVRIQQDIISTRPSMWDKFKGLGHWIRVNLGLRQDSYDLIVESLAGTDSVMYDVLYRGPKRGIVKQKEAQQKAERNFRDSLKADGFFDSVKNPDKWMDERVRVGRFELSRGERMALYMHSLNADNAKAILEGGFGFKNPPPSSGLTPNSVVRITEQELADITKSLTKEEMMMVKAAQSMFRDQGVDLANEFYRLNKYRMPPQENYYPKDVMPLRRGGLDLETEEGLEAFRQFSARVGIEKSMLIERQGSKAPIYLNDLMTDINRSVRKATAYLGLEDPMMNASRMLYDSNFKREIIDRYGRDTWVELEKGLKDIAGSYRSWTSLEKGLTLLKTRAVSSALSINPWVWLNQPFSLATYWAYIEPRYLAKGLIDSITHPKDTLDGLRMYSAELIDRLKTGYDRDVAAVYAAERDKAFYKGKSTLTEKGITPTKYFDLTAVVPGMKAAVYKALEEFQTGELSRPVRQALNVTPEEVMGWTPEQKVAKAHEFADWVTQRTQAQSTPEHRSPLSRGTPLEQMFTAFTSQTNVMLGLVRRTYRDYQRTRDPEALRTMLKAWTSVFVLNAAAMIGVDRLRDLVYGRDSKSIVSGFIDNTASLMYFVRDIVRTMTSFIEEGHRGKESTVPLARFAETLKDLAIHFHDSFSDNHFTAEKAQLGVIDSLLQLGSIYTGLPYQTPKRLLQAATGNNPPPKHRKGEDKSFIDELLED